jgi:hypothetical protein
MSEEMKSPEFDRRAPSGRVHPVVVPCAPAEPFVTMMMDLPWGGKQCLQLDEPAAREMLAEMETWGSDCSKDCQDLRADLRSKFGHNAEVCQPEGGKTL